MAKQRTSEADEITRRLLPNAPDQSQIDKFYEALGRAISGWQLVETSLYEVYEAAIIPKRRGGAAASYHAVQNFSAKLAMTDAAVRFALLGQVELTDKWVTLRGKADDKWIVRNHLAHFSTTVWADKKIENDRITLEAQIYDTRFRTGQRKKPIYRVTEIVDASMSFARLSAKLRAFAQMIPEPKLPRPTSS